MKFEIDGGSFRYPKKERQTLKDIRLSVENGQMTAILGPNGAGKTTLLRCALGLLPWQGGRTLLDGKDIRRIPTRQLWQQIAYVPQARQSISSATVEEMVLLGRSSRMGPFSAPGREDMLAVERAMERLHIGHLRQNKCSQISGGELQMVLIARALAAEPKMLVLDEPESNLDFRNQLLVLDVLSQLAGDGIACLFNTHYPAHALRRAHQALMLGRDGSYTFGPVEQVVTEENIARFFGVRAVIGVIETESNAYQDVVALGTGDVFVAGEPSAGVVATLSVILPDRSQTEAVNRLLHRAAPFVLGRMGMPHPEKNMYVINLVLDAPRAEVTGLLNRLNRLPGVSAKATFEKG